MRFLETVPAGVMLWDSLILSSLIGELQANERPVAEEMDSFPESDTQDCPPDMHTHAHTPAHICTHLRSGEGLGVKSTCYSS